MKRGWIYFWLGALGGGGSLHIIQVNRVYWSERIQTNLGACAVIMPSYKWTLIFMGPKSSFMIKDTAVVAEQ